jgi:thymidylate synthase
MTWKMSRVLSTKEAVDNAIRALLISGQKTSSAKWQGTPMADSASAHRNEIVEVCDIFLRMDMCNFTPELAESTGADLPWAEDHFQERLAGPSNPGEQYKYWPYANDYTAYQTGDKFSHTYQERFWPDPNTGFRFSAGNYFDIENRLSNDPSSRQAFLAIWHPEDQSENNVRVPCTIGYWFKVTKGVLDITYLIRSCDARRHFRNDIYMTQRLAHGMLSALRNEGHDIQLGKMNMWIGSFHCFESDLYALKKQMK